MRPIVKAVICFALIPIVVLAGCWLDKHVFDPLINRVRNR